MAESGTYPRAGGRPAEPAGVGPGLADAGVGQADGHRRNGRNDGELGVSSPVMHGSHSS
jgi:hypothetical protein